MHEPVVRRAMRFARYFCIKLANIESLSFSLGISLFLTSNIRKTDGTSTGDDLLLIIVPRVESGKTAKRGKMPCARAHVRTRKRARTREPLRSMYKIAADIDGCEIGP